MQLEYCCSTRDLIESDAVMQDRFEASIKAFGLDDSSTLVSAKAKA